VLRGPIDIAAPTLLIQGQRDEDVPWQTALTLAETLVPTLCGSCCTRAEITASASLKICSLYLQTYSILFTYWLSIEAAPTLTIKDKYNLIAGWTAQICPT